MALFGRESEAERQRADRMRLWFEARNPMAVISLGFGIMASLDFFTMVLGGLFGVTAIGLGLAALADLRRRPERAGRKLAITGIALGVLGIVLSGSVFFLLHTRHARATSSTIPVETMPATSPG